MIFVYISENKDSLSFNKFIRVINSPQGGFLRKPCVSGKVRQVTHPLSRKSPSVMGLVVLIFLPYIPLVWRQRWPITDAGAAGESRVSNGSGGREHSLLCCWIGGWFTVNPVDLEEFFLVFQQEEAVTWDFLVMDGFMWFLMGKEVGFCTQI